MRYLDLTLATAAENLALDEALLEEAEVSPRPLETLRLWEPPTPMVVVGRSSRAAEEVHLDACRQRGIPVLRRSSGGASIVTGPGCLMYAVVLSYQQRPALRMIDEAHRFVLGKLVSALKPLLPAVQFRGTSDLTVDQWKFSGNSVRCKRDYFLYHGTLLYNFPLELISTCLAMPPREPDYRQGRKHAAFVANLPLPAAAIRQALAATWEAGEPCDPWPRERTAQLVAERFTQAEWNEGR